MNFKTATLVAALLFSLTAHAKLSAGDLAGDWIIDHLDGTAEMQTFDPVKMTVTWQTFDLKTGKPTLKDLCHGTYSFNSNTGELNESFPTCGQSQQASEKLNFAEAEIPKMEPPGFRWIPISYEHLTLATFKAAGTLGIYLTVDLNTAQSGTISGIEQTWRKR